MINRRDMLLLCCCVRNVASVPRAVEPPDEPVPSDFLVVTVNETSEKARVRSSECCRTVSVRSIFDSVPWERGVYAYEGRKLTQPHTASSVSSVIDVVGSD